jgi:hypothetical protein
MPPYGPPGGPGGPGGPGPYGPPPGGKKSPVKLIIAAALALVLVVGIALSAFLFLTGRLGFGPLSAKDKEAASVIADNVEGPEWTDEAMLQCGAEHLLGEKRSGDLSTTGLIEEDGDSWSYDGSQWTEGDATTFYEGVLDCSDDWAGDVGRIWELDDTDCMEDVGVSTMAAYFAGDTLAGQSSEDSEEEPATDPEDAEEMKTDAVEGLDECYVADAPEPEAEAKSAYRAVRFTFSEVDAEGADFVISVNDDSSWQEIDGTTYELDTGEGGVEGCIDAKVGAEYPWGTVSESESEFCGKSAPKKFFWKKLKNCQADGNCVSYSLRYAGFESDQFYTVTYTHNGGDCLSTRGECTIYRQVSATGRGTSQTWSFPNDYNGRFVAKTDVKGVKPAVLPR